MGASVEVNEMPKVRDFYNKYICPTVVVLILTAVMPLVLLCFPIILIHKLGEHIIAEFGENSDGGK